jgi:DNA-binding NarL/FixJ family response regulator
MDMLNKFVDQRIERFEAFFSGVSFDPHRHDTYAIGRTLAGVHCFNYRGDKYCNTLYHNSLTWRLSVKIGQDGVLACIDLPYDTDFVVLDCSNPQFKNKSTLDIIFELNPSVLLVVMSMCGSKELMADVLLTKTTSVISLLSAPEVVAKIVRETIGNKATPSTVCGIFGEGEESFRFSESQQRRISEIGLSIREIQVLELVVAGHTNKAIARKLHIAECTVKTHLTSIFRTLSVTNRTQAVYKIAHV